MEFDLEKLGINVLNIGPNDILVLKMNRRLDPHSLSIIDDAFRRSFPDIRFMIIDDTIELSKVSIENGIT